MNPAAAECTAKEVSEAERRVLTFSAVRWIRTTGVPGEGLGFTAHD